jgi:uncharacterized protein
MIDPLYSLSGFAVGLLVGMTGVGGGSLMTPLLILLFGIHPATAVGSDLLYAAATKTAGSLVHGFARSIEWVVVRRLATGSVPATIVTLTALSFLNLESHAVRNLITIVLCVALTMTATVLLFRGTIVQFYRSRFPALSAHDTAAVTVTVGAVLGVLVSVSSVGAGAVGVIALILLYPQLPMHRIVGSDIAHAVPLTHRTLDDWRSRLAYHRFAPRRFITRHRSRQLCRRPNPGNCVAPGAGGHTYRGCKQARIRSRGKRALADHRVYSLRATLR